MMNLAGKQKPGVMTACPVRIGASFRQAASNSRTPAALNMTLQTPPPMASWVFAALTMAAVFIFVISWLTMVKGMCSSLGSVT